VGKWKNSYKMASKSSKISVEVKRLRGRSEILQQLTFFEKVDQLSTFQKKSNDGRQLVNFQKKIPQKSIYRQKSTVDFKACITLQPNKPTFTTCIESSLQQGGTTRKHSVVSLYSGGNYGPSYRAMLLCIYSSE